MHQNEWTQVITPLLTLALRLEGEGQYNLAKLGRAAVDSLGRRAAYQDRESSPRENLAGDLAQVIEALAELEIGDGLLTALRCGAAALAENRLPAIRETPHPFVCRTCGHMMMGGVTEKCPTCGAWSDTFQWFAPIYWLEAFDPPAALEMLRQTPSEVAELLKGLPEEALNSPPAEGGWSIRNVVAHLRDAQGVIHFRMDLFLKEIHPVLESKAVFAWATQEAERPPSTMEMFETYQVSRGGMLAKLELLPLADWWRTGQHEEFGVVSIKQQVSYFAAHERTHLPQIEKLRSQFSFLRGD